MTLDAADWSGEGAFTKLLIDALRELPAVEALRIEDAPACRGNNTGFSFISNELYVLFASRTRRIQRRKLGFIPASDVRREKLMTIGGLEATLAGIGDIGPPDYSDDGMLQYLRTERILQPYQTRSYKLIELVRVYEAGTIPRRAS